MNEEADMNRLLRYIQHVLVALCCLAGFAACTDDEAVVWGETTAPGIYAGLSLGGEEPLYPYAPSTRAGKITGESDWGENTVASVDYFLFDASGNRLLYKRHTPTAGEGSALPTTPTTTDGLTYYTTTLYPLSTGSDWKTLCTQIVEGCRLYAIVNLSEEKANTVTDLASLQALVVTDADIYKRDEEKLFLMDGVHTFTGEEGYQNNQVYELTVEVFRAAAKVKVNISKGSAWASGDGVTMGTITAGVQNYATNTRVTTDGTPLTSAADADKLALASVTHTASGISAEGTATDTYLGSITFYTFAHNWTETPEEETSLELNVPYTGRENNYYKLVFLPNGGAGLDRNTFYEVDVTIKYDGSERSSDPVELEAKTWRVQPWKTEAFDVQEVTKADYLILSDYYIDLRNEDHTSITFYSSDVVTVELVGFATEADVNETFNDNQETTILESLTQAGFKRYEGHAKSGMDAIPAVYYVNKDNERIDITQDPKANYEEVGAVSYSTAADRPAELPAGHEVYATWQSNVATEGTIDIFSRIPLNVTPRYITLRVTMKTSGGGTLTRYAVVKQYPLEYISGREGMLSYMESKTMQKNDPTKYYTYSCPCPAGLLKGTWDSGTTNHKGGIFNMAVPDSIRAYFNGKVEGSTTTYHVGDGANMKCKFYLPYEGEDEYGIDWTGWKNFATWADAEGTHYGRIYRIDDDFDRDNGKDFPALMDNGVANNNRMYEVVVTATSTDYRISRPLMENITDDDGNAETADNLKVAVSSAENNALLSPRFMLASQLGNNSAVNYWVTARDQCKKYVEIGRDGRVYDDWRLPTIAELKIVKNYQIDDDVYDITMNKVLNSDGDTNPCYWTAQEDVFVYTTGSGGEAPQQYVDEEVRYVYQESTEYPGKYIRTSNTYRSPEGKNEWTLYSTKDEDDKNLGSGHLADGTEYVDESKSKTHIPNLAIRVRCVRDVKVEEVEVYD